MSRINKIYPSGEVMEYDDTTKIETPAIVVIRNFITNRKEIYIDMDKVIKIEEEQ